MNADVYEKVCKCVRSVRTINSEITPASLMMKDLHCESIDVIDLIYFLENEFSIGLTIRELNAYVDSLKNSTWDFSLGQLTDFLTLRTK